MKRSCQLACVALLASVLVLSVAMATSVERTVIPAENATYRVILRLSDEMVAGISESIPAGYEVGEVSVPPGQFRMKDNTLRIAVLGERNVSYLVRGGGNPEREIRGSWTDIVTGETGRIYAHGEAVSPAGRDQQNETAPPVKKSGVNPLLAIVAAMAAVLGAGRWVKGRHGQA